MKIIVVLGSPNEDNGNLSQMAVSRCEKCLEIYKPNSTKIILTGGFGPHFNNTFHPHWKYLQDYLLKKGVFENDILTGTFAKHSVEDATLLVPIFNEYHPENVTVITSDYHIKRAKIIFAAVFENKFNYQLIGSTSLNCDKKIIDLLIEHEIKAIADLEENGVRF